MQPKRGQMDRVQAMQAFVESIKQRGLGSAAQFLGISRTLVTRHIQALETELGVRLMNRTTRSLSLTEAGQKYFHFCEEILTRIEEMDRQIAAEANEARGEVAVLAPKWMQTTATRLMVEFVRRYPEIHPRLVFGGMAQTAYGFLEQGCDIALHTRQIPDSRILARKVADIAYRLCASPAYMKTASELERPSQLAAHRMLVQYNYLVWTFRRGNREERVQPMPALSSGTFLALREAALADLGIALLPEPVVRADLTDGRLECLLPEWEPQGQTLYLAVAPGGGIPTKVRLLLDFARAWFLNNLIEG
jgi:DNA-binding transcriptional LysR family regulator